MSLANVLVETFFICKASNGRSNTGSDRVAANVYLAHGSWEGGRDRSDISVKTFGCQIISNAVGLSREGESITRNMAILMAFDVVKCHW